MRFITWFAHAPSHRPPPLDRYRSINALAETINGLYKTEVINRLGPWKSRRQLELATLEWVHWFNTKRLLGSIGHIPPVEMEAKYFSDLAIERASAEAITLTT